MSAGEEEQLQHVPRILSETLSPPTGPDDAPPSPPAPAIDHWTPDSAVNLSVPLGNTSQDESNSEPSSPTDPPVPRTPFNQRLLTLRNFRAANCGQPMSQAQSLAIMRARAGCLTSPAKTLKLMRELLQKTFTEDIERVVERYMKNYFQPAAINMRENNGHNAVTDHSLRNVIVEMLNDAKFKYQSKVEECKTVSDADSSFAAHLPKSDRERLPKRKHSAGLLGADAESSKIKVQRVMEAVRDGVGPEEKSRAERLDWGMERLQAETQFVVATKASKLLGFGTPGTLFSKHPHLFKYEADEGDRLWLLEHGHVTDASADVFLCTVKDVVQLRNASEQHQITSSLVGDQKWLPSGYSVPSWMIAKMKLVGNLDEENQDLIKHESSTSTATCDLDSKPDITQLDDDTTTDDYSNEGLSSTSTGNTETSLAMKDQFDLPSGSYSPTGRSYYLGNEPSSNNQSPFTVFSSQLEGNSPAPLSDLNPTLGDDGIGESSHFSSQI